MSQLSPAPAGGLPGGDGGGAPPPPAPPAAPPPLHSVPSVRSVRMSDGGGSDGGAGGAGSPAGSSDGDDEGVDSGDDEGDDDDGGEDEDWEYEELVDDEPMQLAPGLFIGSMMAEMNGGALAEAGITHVLQVADGLRPTHGPPLAYLTLPTNREV